MEKPFFFHWPSGCVACAKRTFLNVILTITNKSEIIGRLAQKMRVERMCREAEARKKK